MLPESCMGELSIFARRKGDMWVLAVMCGSKARTTDVQLNVLDEGTYQASVARDEMQKDAAVVLITPASTERTRSRSKCAAAAASSADLTRSGTTNVHARRVQLCHCRLAQQCIFAPALRSLGEAPLSKLAVDPASASSQYLNAAEELLPGGRRDIG